MEYVYQGKMVILTPAIVKAHNLTTSQICNQLRKFTMGVEVFKLTQKEAVALIGKGPRNGLFLVTRAGYYKLLDIFKIYGSMELVEIFNKPTSTSLTKAGDPTKSAVIPAVENTTEAVRAKHEDDELLDLMAKIASDRRELAALRSEVKTLRETFNSIKALLNQFGG